MHTLAPLRIAIQSEFPALLDQAKQLSASLNLPMANKSENYDFLLMITSERLQLQDQRPNAPGSVFVDFIEGKNAHRRLYGGGRKQPLAKAVGFKKDFTPTVIDATAGLGRDSFVLASLGCDITLLERSPIMGALLQDGLTRAALHTDIADIISRMHFVQTDATAYLQTLASNTSGRAPADNIHTSTIYPDTIYPDTIYMDPMYPHRNKSALVKKEMRIARELVGDDEDATTLLATALSCARKRVVVKRPKTAPTLSSKKPSLIIESKNTRYDIYLIQPSI